MNIDTKSTNNLNSTANTKPVETAETAGSLAYQPQYSWFAKSDATIHSAPQTLLHRQ